MNFLDRFTSIDDLLVSLLERIGGVTEEDTHFFSYPNDGTRGDLETGTTTIDFMSGTIMSASGAVTSLGNSLRARGREYCRSLSMQADRDIIIQIGTKSKIPIFAGTWFKVAHLRFTELNIIAAEATSVFVIACTNPDSIEMVGESYPRDPVDSWSKMRPMGNGELAVRTHAPAIIFDRRGDVLRWIDFESATPGYTTDCSAGSTAQRTTKTSLHGDFSMECDMGAGDAVKLYSSTNDFHQSRLGVSAVFSTDTEEMITSVYISYYDGIDVHTASLRFNPSLSPNVIQIYTPDGWETIGTAEYNLGIHSFSTIKLVADLSSMKYIRAIVFGQEIDVSEHDLYTAANGSTERMEYGTIFETADSMGSAYVDDIILHGKRAGEQLRGDTI